MSRSSAELQLVGRVAIVGAPAETGVRLREALAEAGVPGARVDLYGASAGEMVLGEYDGEARMIQGPDVDEIAGHALVFVCDADEALARALAAGLPAETTVIDLADRRPAGSAAEGWHAVAHPLALVLRELLQPLAEAFGVREASAVILRPASDFGAPGVEELRDQTVRLFNFAEVPVRTFGRQLAFNVIPHGDLAGERPDLPRRIAGQVGELLGWRDGRLAVALLAVPLFYGHGVQLRVRLDGAPPLADVRDVLARAGLLDGGEPRAPATPLEVAGSERTCLSDLAEDGLGGLWMWGVAGEAGARAARLAVDLAASLSRP